jgi:phage recombination protein Bet
VSQQDYSPTHDAAADDFAAGYSDSNSDDDTLYYDVDGDVEAAQPQPPRALATVPAMAAPAIVAPAAPSRAEIEALKDTIKASNATMTDAQFTVFMAAARRLGLDPLARQIVPIFQSGKMSVQTTIDGFRLIAERSGRYRGQIGPFWCGKDGAWRDVWLEDGAPAAAKVGVKRSDFDEPVYGVARYKSYAKGGNWQQMPDVMLAKVAESLALRKAFPAELSGAYTREELAQAEADDADMAPIVESYPTPTTTPAPATATVRPAGSPVTLPNPVQWNPYADVAFRKRCNTLGWTSVANIDELLQAAGALTDTEGVYHKDKALAFLVNEEAKAAAAGLRPARKGAAR